MKSHILLFLLILLSSFFALHADAQSADRLYEQGKALYDAKHYAEAVPKLLAAAKKGHKKAQYRIARCYAKGHGVEENDVEAFAWYMKAAQQSYPKAQYRVGRCYRKGNGVAKDLQKAILWYTKAAKNDNGSAQLELGICYMKGRGVAADAKKASYWLNKAIRNEKKGKEILATLKHDAAEGDEDAKAVLTIVGR